MKTQNTTDEEEKKKRKTIQSLTHFLCVCAHLYFCIHTNIPIATVYVYSFHTLYTFPSSSHFHIVKSTHFFFFLHSPVLVSSKASIAHQCSSVRNSSLLSITTTYSHHFSIAIQIDQFIRFIPLHFTPHHASVSLVFFPLATHTKKNGQTG